MKLFIPSHRRVNINLSLWAPFLCVDLEQNHPVLKVRLGDLQSWVLSNLLKSFLLCWCMSALFPTPSLFAGGFTMLTWWPGTAEDLFPHYPAPEAMGWVSLESAFELSRFTLQVFRGKQNPVAVFFKSHASSLKLKFPNLPAILMLWARWTTGGVISSVKPKCVILARRNSNFALHSMSSKVAAALILFHEGRWCVWRGLREKHIPLLFSVWVF